MNQRDFEELYDDYTQIMLFASSNRPKFKNMELEIAEIEDAFHELMNDSPQNLLDSIKTLKTNLNTLGSELKAFLYRYERISEMIRQIDILISDYYKSDIEISLYELNGMENDLLNVK